MASQMNINIDQGASFALQLTLADENGNLIDVTKYAFTSMMRQNYNQDVVVEFTVTTLDAANAKIEISLTPTQTAGLSGGMYVWDMVGILPNGDVARIVEGQAEVLEGVTNYNLSSSQKVIVRSAFVGRDIANTMTLGGFPPSFYLDYRNFNNVPTNILDFGITDGGAGTVLTTDGNGNFSFEPIVHNATTLNGQTGNYYLNYDNLQNKPLSLQDFDVADGLAGQVLTTDGAGNWYFDSLSNTTVQATELGGQPPSYYLDYNNLANVPTSILHLDVTDGTPGQFLQTDGMGGFTFATVAGGAGGDANTLQGQGPAYYLDYNNLINKPTVAQNIFQLGVVDGNSGDVLVTDGLGNVSFQAPSTDASTLNGLAPSHYLNYNNLVNKPTIPTAGSQLTWGGQVGQHLASNGAGSFYWETPSTDAKTLDGKIPNFYRNYNNLFNTPTIPQKLFDLDVVDGSTYGQVLTTNANGYVYFDDILLDNKPGSFYLDYNNFTNKPVIVDNIKDLNDVVNGYSAVTGQVLTCVGGGQFAFTTIEHDATTFNNKLPSHYLDYNNLSNKPFIPLNFLDLLDMQDGYAGQVLTTHGNGLIRFASLPTNSLTSNFAADSDMLDGQHGSYYLDYNNLTNVPANIGGSNITDISQLTDTTNIIPNDVSDLTDTTNVIPNDVGDLTDINGLLLHPTVPTDVSQLTDTSGLLVHFSGDYNALYNKPVINNFFTTGISFNVSNGVLQQTLNNGSVLTADLDGRYLQSVNGVVGNASGNAALNLVGTETGTEAERLAYAPTDGLIWVVSGDVDPNNDGRTYIYSSSDTTWHQIVGYDTAAMDARYVNQNVDGIDHLVDVDTSTVLPANGEVLAWNGSNWVPGKATLNIDDLGDVDTSTTSPLVSQTLRWNGTKWVPGDANDKFVASGTFDKTTGNLRLTYNDSTFIDAHMDGRYAESVNGIVPDTNGNVAISLVKTQVGTEAQRTAATPTEGTVWVVSGDTNPNNDGKTYIYTAGAWYAVATQDQAAMDARYVNHTDTYVQKVNGQLPDATGNVTVTLGTTEVGTELQRAAFVPVEEGTIWVVTGDADPNNDGKTYVWNSEDTTWYQVSSFDQAAMDARYVQHVESIDSLSDVNTTTTAPTDGQTLMWDATASQWVPGDGAGSNAVYKTETTVATAGLTTFALAFEPTGDVHFTRNGSSLPTAAFSVSGQTVTYDPAGNNGDVIDAGDEITISYLVNTSDPIVSTNVISDNTDVNTAGALVGDGLIFDGTEWKPGVSSAVGAIDDLSDVDTSTVAPTNGQTLAWNASQSKWMPTQQVTLPAAEYGQYMLANNITVAADATETIGTMDLPSAGTYELTFSTRLDPLNWGKLWFKDGNGVNIEESITITDYDRGDVTFGSVHRTVIYEATGPETITLKAYAHAQSMIVVNDGNGKTIWSYNKIAEFVPYIDPPTQAQVLHANLVSNEQMAPGKVLTFAATNNINIEFDGQYATLKAGVTYELEAAVNIDHLTTANEWTSFEWRDSSGNAYGNRAWAISREDTRYGTGSAQQTAVAVITPTTDMQVGLTVVIGSSTVLADASYSYIKIKAVADRLPLTAEAGDQFGLYGPYAAGNHATGYYIGEGETVKIHAFTETVAAAPHGFIYLTRYNGRVKGYSNGNSVVDVPLGTASPTIGYGLTFTVATDGEIIVNHSDTRWNVLVVIEGKVEVTIVNQPSISEASDTLIGSPQVGDLLAWDGTQWVNQSPTVQLPGGVIQMQAYDIWNSGGVVTIRDQFGADIGMGVSSDWMYIKVPFTPKSDNSIITIHIDAEFRISGDGADDFIHATTIFDSTDTNQLGNMRFIRHTSIYDTGEMGRSNMLFPLTSVFQNSDTNPKIYVTELKRGGGNDIVRVWNGIITITEVQK